MGLQTTTVPYEFLVRWNDAGQLGGAHIAEREVISVDDVVVSSKYLDPRPVALGDAVTLAAIGGVINSAMLARVAELEGQLAAVTDAKDAATAAKETAEAEIVTLRSRIEELTPSAGVTEIYPFDFQRLLTKQQKVVIWNTNDSPMFELKVDLLTVSTNHPMPFGEGSALRGAVLAIGQALPELFPPSEIERIFARQPPE